MLLSEKEVQHMFQKALKRRRHEGGSTHRCDQKSNELDFAPPQSTLPIYASADPVVEESIRKGVAKMKLTELKDALRLRNLNTIGSKQALQERLFYSLMDDAGFQSGFAP